MTIEELLRWAKQEKSCIEEVMETVKGLPEYAVISGIKGELFVWDTIISKIEGVQ